MTIRHSLNLFIFALFPLLISVPQSQAVIELSGGATAATGGRLRPAVGLGLHFSEKWTLSGYATGVNHHLYYHSAYTLGFYGQFIEEDVLWGPLRASIGGAVHYSQRGYRQTRGGLLDKTDDVALGPAFRVVWHFGGPLFFSVDALFGISTSLAHLLLSFQDMQMVSLGVRF